MSTDPLDQVEIKARIPQAEYDKFRDAFPQYGAVTWFVNAALVRFNRLVEENPSLQDVVADAVEEMVRDTRAREG